MSPRPRTMGGCNSPKCGCAPRWLEPPRRAPQSGRSRARGSVGNANAPLGRRTPSAAASQNPYLVQGDRTPRDTPGVAGTAATRRRGWGSRFRPSGALRSHLRCSTAPLVVHFLAPVTVTRRLFRAAGWIHHPLLKNSDDDDQNHVTFKENIRVVVFVFAELSWRCGLCVKKSRH